MPWFYTARFFSSVGNTIRKFGLACLLLACSATPTSEPYLMPNDDSPKKANDGRSKQIGGASTPSPPSQPSLHSNQSDGPVRPRSPAVATNVEQHPKYDHQPNIPLTIDVPDRGIFDDLRPSLSWKLPADLQPFLCTLVDDYDHLVVTLYCGEQAISNHRIDQNGQIVDPKAHLLLQPFLQNASRVVLPHGAAPPFGDTDGDGICDPLDIQIGAIKTVLNGARYDGSYHRMDFPGGDVDRNTGVCTDVIIRSLRNAGYDLQELVATDMKRHPKRYRRPKRIDTHIVHRRVRNLLPYFQHHWPAITVEDPLSPQNLIPGDLVFLDTIPSRTGPDHLGIVSRIHSTQNPDRYLIINNWDVGSQTARLDLLGNIPVTHAFRTPWKASWFIPNSIQFLIVVVAPNWTSSHGKLSLFQREAHDWKNVEPSLAVRLGENGMGWGIGVHGVGAAKLVANRSDPIKREGDRKTPAGMFRIEVPYTRMSTTETSAVSNAKTIDPRDLCVDDTKSRYYGRIVNAKDQMVRADWKSAEQMHRQDHIYDIVLPVAHNQVPMRRGAGSCIFMHLHDDAAGPTLGCIALARDPLLKLLESTKGKETMMIVLPRRPYQQLQARKLVP